jgi:membrane protease YdiL (CAAX protease family)
MADAPPVVRRPSVAWGLPSAVGALALTLTSAVIGQFVLRASLGRGFDRQHQLTFSILSYQFIAAGVILSLILLIFLPYRSRLQSVGFRFPGWTALAVAAASVILILFAVAGLVWFFNTFLPGYHIHGNAQEILPGKRRHLPLLQQAGLLLWAAVEAPLVEETLFRGIVHQGIRQFFVRWLPRWAAVLLAALVSGFLFGLAHGEPHTLPILVLLGVILAYVFEATRSLYGSMVVHGLINALAVVNLLHGP